MSATIEDNYSNLDAFFQRYAFEKIKVYNSGHIALMAKDHCVVKSVQCAPIYIYRKEVFEDKIAFLLEMESGLDRTQILWDSKDVAKRVFLPTEEYSVIADYFRNNDIVRPLVEIPGDTRPRKDNYDILDVIKNVHNKTNGILWDSAFAVHQIICSKDYRDKYTNMAGLAKALNICKGRVSQYNKAATFAIAYQLDTKKFTVDQVYYLSSLGGRWVDFVSKLEASGIDVSRINQAEFRNLVYKFKKER